jgi:hypothetical protein
MEVLASQVMVHSTEIAMRFAACFFVGEYTSDKF